MNRLMDFKDMVKYLHVSRPTLYRLVQDRKIPATKVGGQWRFMKQRIDKWLIDREGKSHKL